MATDEEIQKAEDEALRATTGKPTINMTPTRSMCGIHGNVFRAKWPAGYALFTVTALREVMSSDATKDEVAKMLGDAVDADSTRAVEEMLDRKPLCCRLKPSKLIDIFGQTGVGKTGKCEICGRVSEGVAYSTVSREYGHVCFICIASAEQPS